MVNKIFKKIEMANKQLLNIIHMRNGENNATKHTYLMVILIQCCLCVNIL